MKCGGGGGAIKPTMSERGALLCSHARHIYKIILIYNLLLIIIIIIYGSKEQSTMSYLQIYKYTYRSRECGSGERVYEPAEGGSARLTYKFNVR